MARHLLARFELEKPVSALAPPGVWSNEDQEPVPRKDWTYSTFTYLLYWISDLVNAGSWSTVSAFVVLGLTWWEAVLAILVGSMSISVLLTFNGIIGARLHTPFAVTSRAALGVQFAKFAVISRMLLAWFWFSINSYQGGSGVRQMLIALSPNFRYMPNHLPASAGITSSEMLCFFLFWVIQFPFCIIHPKNLRLLFLVKAVTLPIVAFATMIWAIRAAGDQANAVLTAPSTLAGSAGFLAFMTAATGSMGTWSTMACNIGDFARYSKKESSALLQLLFIPFLFTVTAIFGAVSSNCTIAIYGEPLFQPFDIIDRWQNTGGGRVAAFVAAAAWSLGSITTNASANSISAANDLTSLMPRYVNIFRGQLVAIIFGTWAFAPWKVLASADSFISFMASYSIVLAPIASILAADYFLVKKSKYDTVALYDPNGIYYYRYGINWRAAVALVIAITPNLPGMANALDPSVNIGGLKYLYAVADIYGMITAAVLHTLLSRMFPDRTSLIEKQILAHEVIEQRALEGSEDGESEKDKGLEGKTSEMEVMPGMV